MRTLYVCFSCIVSVVLPFFGSIGEGLRGGAQGVLLPPADSHPARRAAARVLPATAHTHNRLHALPLAIAVGLIGALTFFPLSIWQVLMHRAVGGSSCFRGRTCRAGLPMVLCTCLPMHGATHLTIRLDVGDHAHPPALSRPCLQVPLQVLYSTGWPCFFGSLHSGCSSQGGSG